MWRGSALAGNQEGHIAIDVRSRKGGPQRQSELEAFDTRLLGHLSPREHGGLGRKLPSGLCGAAEELSKHGTGQLGQLGVPGPNFDVHLL